MLKSIGRILARQQDSSVLTEEQLLDLVQQVPVPQHIAIIMDGNGRWAQRRGMPRTFGHRAGVETLHKTVKLLSDIGVRYLTVYAFSTENWKRPHDEVSFLMNLFVEYLRKELQELHQNKIKIRFIGDVSGLPEAVQREIDISAEQTRNNSGMTLNIAANYGGRAELVQAIRSIATEIRLGNMTETDVNEQQLSSRLDTGNQPDPDLLIRPGGDYRISNFLLWQLAYTEFWFTDICWPDIKAQHLLQAIYDFQQRDRRFGGLKAKK